MKLLEAVFQRGRVSDGIEQSTKNDFEKFNILPIFVIINGILKYLIM